MEKIRGFKLSVVSFLTLSAALVAVGCGSGGSDSESATTTATPSSGVSAEVKADHAALMSAKGVGYESPPTSGPKPQAGKKIWVISCSQSVPSCSYPAAETVAAAKALGWKTTLYDAKADPSRIAQGYRLAVAAGADGIIPYSLDCSISKAGLIAAKKAKIPVVTAEALDDCGGAPLFTGTVAYTQGDFGVWWTQYGAAQATNVIVGTDAKAKVITFTGSEYPMLKLTVAGFAAELKESCSGCEILQELVWTTPDIGAKLQEKMQQALLRNPTANAFYLSTDLLALGPEGAIRTSGRSKDLFVATAEGQISTMDWLRSGAIHGAGVGVAQGWEAYAMVDGMNRILNGEKMAPSGMGLQAYDKTTNMPSEGRWEPPIDYKSVYLKTWGVG